MAKAKPSEVGCAAGPRGFAADAFSGASPVVASALGIRLDATPRGQISDYNKEKRTHASGYFPT